MSIIKNISGANALQILAIGNAARFQVCSKCGCKFKFHKESTLCYKCFREKQVKTEKKASFRSNILSLAMDYVEHHSEGHKRLKRVNISRVERAIREGETDLSYIIAVIINRKDYEKSLRNARKVKNVSFNEMAVECAKGGRVDKTA